MKLPKLKLNSSLIIAVVGHKDCGKSSATVFLIDAFIDSGITSLKDKRTLLTELLKSPVIGGLSTIPRVLFYDGVDSESELQELRKYNTIVIRIRYGAAVYTNGASNWIENCNPDLVLNNDLELRRFEFVVRDAVKNILPSLKQWQEAISYE